MTLHRSDVSMIAEAREAQWNPQTFMGGGTLEARAPAKINLYLAVGSRNPDGFHNVTTVLHSLALHDRLYLHREPTDDVSILSDEHQNRHNDKEPESDSKSFTQAIVGPARNLRVAIEIVDSVHREKLQVPAEDNLITKAFDRLAQAISYDNPEIISVRLEKHVPAQGGLGGGSSDGATALKAACQWWGLRPTDEVVIQVAKSLGSDVPFFLSGGCGLFDGRGDQFVRSLKPSSQTVVLIKPAASIGTADAYKTFDADPVEVPESLAVSVMAAQAAKEVPLFNNLESAADRLCEPLLQVRAFLTSHFDTVSTLLCGSGSTIAAFPDNLNMANKLAAEASAQGWWSRVTMLAPWGATIRDAF